MNLEEIKAAIENGENVYWKQTSYKVIKDKIGQYLIIYLNDDSCIGLTWADGITLNGKKEDFFKQ